MYNYSAKILEWIDGDTIWVEVDLGFYVFTKQKVRLARIDAPEMDSHIPYQKRQANHARAVARKFCPEGSAVIITTQKQNRDHFARYIAEVTFNSVNVSDYLIDKKVVNSFK